MRTGGATIPFGGLAQGGGGAGGVRLDVQNFCCPEYLALMVQKIKQNWNAIIAQVLSLRSTGDTAIRTTDIYNPVVNLLKLYGVFDQAKPHLDDINRHIHLTAIANRIPVARVYREFNGAHDYICWRGSLADGLLALLGDGGAA